MKFSVLTLFPDMFSPLKQSIIGKAIEDKKIELNLINIRDFSKDKHKKVDDTPYGGGAGMEMQKEPIYLEYDDITHDSWYNNDIWRARISSGICYIWGESSHEVYISIFKMLSYSMSLGISKNGNIVIRDYILPSPAFIPDGSIVSVIQLS